MTYYRNFINKFYSKREIVRDSKLRYRQTQAERKLALACCGTKSSSEVEQSNDAWQSFKLLLFEVGCSHNMSVTLQAVQTERRLHIDESAFHGTLSAFTYGLLTTKCEVKIAGYF